MARQGPCGTNPSPAGGCERKLSRKEVLPGKFSLLRPFPWTLRGASDLALGVLPKEEPIGANHMPPLAIIQRQAEDILERGLDLLQGPRSLGHQKVTHGGPVSRCPIRFQDLDDPLMLVRRVFATRKDAMNLLGHHFDRCPVNHARAPFSCSRTFEPRTPRK